MCYVLRQKGVILHEAVEAIGAIGFVNPTWMVSGGRQREEMKKQEGGAPEPFGPRFKKPQRFV